MQNDPPYNKICACLVAGEVERFSVFNCCHFTDAETSGQKGFRHYLFSLVCFAFMFLPIYLLPDASYQQHSTVFFSGLPAWL